MLHAYSRLKQVLAEQELTVPGLWRRIQHEGLRVNLKSLYRLSNDRQPVERLDLRVAGVICEVCRVPLSELITFETPRHRLRRFPPSKQKRLDILMTKNNDGTLNRAEQTELQSLVREAEKLTLENARTLATHGSWQPVEDPRNQIWEDHFRWAVDRETLIGLTRTGRVTIAALDLNSELRREARRFWFQTGWLPVEG